MNTEALVQEILTHAQERGVMIATAESCTGGMVGAAITAVPGSSAVFERGFLTYSNAAKREMLGVTEDALDHHGAVSEAVALEMVQGALAHSRAQLTVSITGIAGPGGSDHKPEGRVCFGVADATGTTAETIEFGAQGRDAVRAAATHHALGLLASRLR